MGETCYKRAPVDPAELKEEARQHADARIAEHQEREWQRAEPYIRARAFEDAVEAIMGVPIGPTERLSTALDPGRVRPYDNEPLTHVVACPCPSCGVQGGEEVYEDGEMVSRSLCGRCQS
jgi:hypothetical protein